jgi:redox-sensitive bicupin YhaK (pirin superfamily)
MIRIRRGEDRGRTRLDWLDSRHSFSFGDYHDPGQMGFRTLRVINEDRVSPGGGFATHGHRDMEIISYVLEGALQHRDSLGTGSVIHPGEVQRMSAGTGIRHSEFNHSEKEPAHFLQIWIIPERDGLQPGYEQITFDRGEALDRFRLIGDREDSQGAVRINQDARIYTAVFGPGGSDTHDLAPGRGAWVQVARGIVTLNGDELREGDGAAVEGEPAIRLRAETAAEILLLDLG